MSAEPSLVRVEITICTLCLNGVGGECHVPGCWFWMWEAPSDAVAERIRSWAFTEIVAANKDAFEEKP